MARDDGPLTNARGPRGAHAPANQPYEGPWEADGRRNAGGRTGGRQPDGRVLYEVVRGSLTRLPAEASAVG
jgi:hypothetical protein